MSILIKGMVMPKTCQICKTARLDRIVGCEAFDLLSIAERMYKRSPKCPFIEVLTPHGRLIDADELTGCLATLLQFPSNLVNGQWIVNTIREQPTIIPADKEDRQ